jgi:hypothetical protein
MRPEAAFKEKREVWDPILELTIASPYLIGDSSQASIPEMTNANECFHKYSKWNNQQEKGEYADGGGKW